MKLTINTKNKTILLKKKVNVEELTGFLEKAFGDMWREYTILPAKRTIEYIYYDYPEDEPIPVSPDCTTSTIDIK